MKGRQIIKRTVVSLSEAADVGKVENIVFDREARMAALVIRQRGQHKGTVAVTGIGNVHALGRDVITLEESEAIAGAEKLEELQNLPNLRQLVSCRVITEGGIFLGVVRDVLLDVEERRITDFELKGRGVLGRLRGDTIPAAGRLRFGKQIVVVPNTVAVRGRAVIEQIITAPVPESVAASTLVETMQAALAEPAKAATEVLAANHNDAGEEGLTREVGA